MTLSHVADSHAMQPYWNVLLASVQADALHVALELGVFFFLPAAPRARSLASLIDTDAAATRHLLDVLWSMGLVSRRADSASGGTDYVYALEAVASEHFVRTSPRFCGDAWTYRLTSLREAGAGLRGRLQPPVADEMNSASTGVASTGVASTGVASTGVASTGVASNEAAATGPASNRMPPASSPPAARAAMGAVWAGAARAQIGQEQRAFTADAACRVMARVPVMATATRLLDLGGGPGWVAIELVRQHPQLQAVVFDWPETAAVAQENIISAGLEERLAVIGGDLAHDDIGTGYDVIWCASVLHFVPDPAAALRRIHAALRPGGVLVCAQAEVGATPQEAVKVLPYYLHMMMSGRHVTAAGNMAQALHGAGFTVVDSFVAHDFPMAPLTVWIATRAAA
ncbi:methyltransferase [Pigmentiphaga litoralis]|uniref:methyltransferase n=1 Tax=Pigmentiphaga litoralis TaxID=516702 RepID=UPI003B434E5E